MAETKPSPAPDAVARVKAEILSRLNRTIEAREQAVRAALRSDETWYRFRQMFPPPEELEGR